jgi:hypothetical protein
MSLDLYVDGDQWRAHLRRVRDAEPDIVPVAKGNGYGFGLASLARRAAWLGSDTLAIGTYREVPQVLDRFPGDVLVLEPWRPFTTEVTYGPRILHTLGRLEDLTALADAADRPRVVLEGLTSMGRHGLHQADLARIARGDSPRGLRVEGHALHLPLGSGHADEVGRWLEAAPSATWFVSHLSNPELAGLRAAHPETRLRPRIGTALWLGDRDALQVRATVLDARRVERGDRAGYRRRRMPTAGTLLVVSGGTGHGIGLEAPSPVETSRERVRVLARGGLEAAGRLRSPFLVRGQRLWFVEPPHMQVSLVVVPDGLPAPDTGEQIDVRVRFTTTLFDRTHLD